MSADDARPTVPAIPLRTRQRHKVRAKKDKGTPSTLPSMQVESLPPPTSEASPEASPVEATSVEATSVEAPPVEEGPSSVAAEPAEVASQEFAAAFQNVEAETSIEPATKLPPVTELFAEKIEAFFRTDESIPPAPSVEDDDAFTEPLRTPPPVALTLETDERLLEEAAAKADPAAIATTRRRRTLGRIVGAAVFASSILCLGALVRMIEQPGRSAAPAAAHVAPQAETTTDLAPPAAAAEIPSSSAAIDIREEARALLVNRKIDEAIVVAQRAVDADPGDATAWLILGAAQMDANRLSEANATFRGCVENATTGPVTECRSFVR